MIITREYEHLIVALSMVAGKPRISYFRLPHPSGMVYDARQERLHIASTRNPNQIFSFASCDQLMPRKDVDQSQVKRQQFEKVLIPQKTLFLPGCFYIHDLGLIGNELHANSVGQNTIIKINDDGSVNYRWWPACIEVDGNPDYSQNYLQLNSIAAGDSMETSYFSASAAKISARRPGHKNFPVDKRGVIFSGKTRAPIAGGLTRPHSARLYCDKILVDNSGYGELVSVESGQTEVISRLPGWTRGLAIVDDIAFVGTSHVLSKFSQYAPGLDAQKSVCGIHIIDLASGKSLGNMTWQYGNQIFAIEVVSSDFTRGFPFIYQKKPLTALEKMFFYSYKPSIEDKR